MTDENNITVCTKYAVRCIAGKAIRIAPLCTNSVSANRYNMRYVSPGRRYCLTRFQHTYTHIEVFKMRLTRFQHVNEKRLQHSFTDYFC